MFRKTLKKTFNFKQFVLFLIFLTLLKKNNLKKNVKKWQIVYKISIDVIKNSINNDNINVR